MKLIRFGPSGHERPGILDDQNRRRDCSGGFADWDRAFFHNDGLRQLADWLPAHLADLPVLPDNIRHGPPIARPGKVICIGLNYRDHAAESNLPMPAEPLIFLKAPNTVVGPYDDLLLPRGGDKVDWEVELGVVIGTEARYLPSVDAARNHIAGYCISHDVSERGFQFERGGQWTKGKSCDSFNPIGPWLSTAADLPDPMKLTMSLDVNGQRKQTGATSTMAFGPAFLVHYLSRFMTLESGDLITTGTPPGVGFARKPPEFLVEGDVVELRIEGLGTQRQTCRQG